MTDTIPEYSSYKDPISSLFYYQDQVYRFFDCQNLPFYADLLNNRLVLDLMAKGDLVQTELVKIDPSSDLYQQFGISQLFQHEKLPFISYPYEWSFSMFKEAAIFTLNLQKKFITQNLSLKDATPFNIQFKGAQPIFIDFGSFEPISLNGAWFAYNQFMQMFAYPLMLKSFAGIDFKSQLITHFEGITFKETYKLLGLKPKLKPGLLSYLLIPKMLSVGSSKSKLRDARAASRTLNPQTNQAVQTFMINRLQKLIRSLKYKTDISDWSDYAQTKSYSQEAETIKQEFVKEFFQRNKVSTTLDLGANTGEYSFIAESAGSAVMAVESDHDSIDRLYLEAHQKRLNILPLWIDIANPTPAIGWNNRERKSFLERYQAHCVLALALIHHLLISNRQPLIRIVELLAQLSQRYLIVEFVGRNDPMFQLLILNRKESYDYYDLSYFKSEFDNRFKILEQKSLPNMEREIFLMEKIN